MDSSTSNRIDRGVAFRGSGGGAELGVDYLASNDNPDRRRRHLVNQLERLGYTVDLSPAA